MQSNFESLDNLELRVQKSSVVQQRAGLVVSYMYKQFIDFHNSTLNTNEMFIKILENLAEVLDYLKQSLSIRNVPVQNIHATVDNNKTLAVVNILWHKISFTSRFNNSPKALPQKSGSPVFCGRIIAMKGDFSQIVNEKDDYDKQMEAVLKNEIASLYVPAEKGQSAIMTITQRDDQQVPISQIDAPRDFLLKVVEDVCAGGEFHKQNKKSSFLFDKNII